MKTKENIIVSLVVVFAFGMVTSPVFAQSTTPSTSTPKHAQVTQRVEQRQSNLQAQAQKEISRRLTSLQSLLTRITSAKHLTADQKSTLQTQAQSQITDLTTLQTKITQDTDTATLKTDVQSIVKSYRIYALFLPKAQIVIAADKMLDVTDELTPFSETLQTKVTTAQTTGQDISSLTPLLADITAKIADAKTQSQNAIAAVTPLTPDGYPGNKTTLLSARNMLKTGRQDLDTAMQDVKKIVKAIKTVKSPPVTP